MQIAVVLAILLSLLSRPMEATIYNVLDYGAVGDGDTDDSNAFSKAWSEACGSPGTDEVPTLFVPPSRTFLVNPVKFKGPCTHSSMGFQIAGQIAAPLDESAWEKNDTDSWIGFHGVEGLSVWGHGLVDGRGYSWWNSSCKRSPESGCTSEAPKSMAFCRCQDVNITDMEFRDSPQMHVTFLDTVGVLVSNVTIVAPESSPNTDGIHLERTTNVFITSSFIGTGDDCISIGNGTYDVNITNIVCGPGHGISIGSLGKKGANSIVERIHVESVHFNGTTNGARIKTWPGGSGNVSAVTFTNITFEDVKNPIIIDQYYNSWPYDEEDSAVQVSDVRYMEMTGTCQTPLAVNLKCSQSFPCTSLLLDNVNITSAGGGGATSNCSNAEGSAEGYVYPSVPCLSNP